MKTMMLTISGLVILTSCKKYEECPGFSILSKKERVTNLWKVDYAYELRDSVITTADYTGETWEFVSDKERITLKFSLGMQSYGILKPKEKELWLKDAQEELHLIPANKSKMILVPAS